MAKKPREGDGGSPYQPYKPKPSGPYVPAPKLAKGTSKFSTPYLDDLRNINKFKENADKVFKKKKKPGTNNVNEV